MIAVLDASAAAEIVLHKVREPLFSEIIAQSDSVVSSSLFIPEVTNIFWKYARLSYYQPQVCLDAMNHALSLVDEYLDARDLYLEAFSEGLTYQHSIYDLFYILLARRKGAIFLTVDEKARKLAEKMAVRLG